ncbi:hypothetical protein EW026_g5395 [Hermanssonia centrifuga]|uniref:GH18 domain-containing protein n=1 Tax=Hermanssonia centrifuga TaxID=98765 RepID=A0A4S4KE82_9APHY|nr:hypothetical protein EW026_g5395 [Hermanssonia centrifuga]
MRTKFGFCGSTDEFCVDECADDPSGHCGKVSVPTNAGASVLSRVIGYYESWASARPCSAWYPQNVPADGYTHLNFAFAGIDPDSSQIVPGSGNDPTYYNTFTGLKKLNLDLKTYISVGGWAFNDPPTQRVFSTVAGDVGKSQTFATSAVAFMIQYGFDGMDIDWEYPAACERGGAPEDFANFPRLLSILRQTFDASGHTFGLTFTAPSSFWYLQQFDLQNLLKYADWINLMSYDLHGTWDAKDAYIGNIVGAHTNLTEIDQSLQLFMRAGVPLNKIVLGLGFYGRSFELSDKDCAAPGCPFNGPAAPGPCTASAGILSYSEIQDVITRTNPANIVHDQTAAVKYFEFDDGVNVDQWVSYDDADTFKQKIDYANGAGLGGVMVWAADQDDFAGSALSAILGQPVGTIIPTPDGFGSNDAQSCTVMDCGVACPSGFVQPILTVAAKPEVVRFVAQQETNLKIVNGVAQLLYVTVSTFSSCCCILAYDTLIRPGKGFAKLEKSLLLAILGARGRNAVPDTNSVLIEIQGNSVTAPFTLDELFDNPSEDEDMSYKLQTETINDDNPDAGNDNPETTPFGLVVIDGPDHYVSDLTRRSNWELIGCHPTEETQNVRAVCTKGQNDASCNHVFIRAAEDTIVKMPNNCGPGPYARIVSLTPSKTARLSKRVQQLDESIRPIVYDLIFDYKFNEIRAPADMEPALLRIDVTNIPGYWDEIVTGTTRRRDLLNDPQMIKRGLEERWFGAFDDWLAKTTQVKSDTSARLDMQQAFSTTLFSASQNCASEDGSTQFASSLNVAVHGNAQAHVTFGLYVQGHVLPSPSIDAAYVYIVSQATANLGFEVTGKASVTYDPGQVKMIPEIAWPGLSVPGTFSLTSNWDTGEFYYSVGTGDQHQEAAKSDPQFATDWQVTPHADVQLDGNLAVHVIPTASLGINILSGLINAQANLVLDGSVYVDLSASLSGAHVSVGDVVRLDASVTGTGFNYPGYNFFNLQRECYSADVTFGFTKRDYIPTVAMDDLVSDGLYGALPYTMNGSTPRLSQEKRGLLDAFGFLKCPTAEEGGGSGDDCFNALLDEEDLSDADVNEERRRDIEDLDCKSNRGL